MQILIPKTALSGWFSCFNSRRSCGPLRLVRRRVFGFRHRKDCRISCSSGCVWITGGRDQQDVILQAGETIRLERRVKIVVEAIEDAIISIEPVHETKERRLNWSSARLHHS